MSKSVERMKLSDIYCGYLDDIERLEKENKLLKERLTDADHVIAFYDSKDFHYEVDGVVMGAEPAHKYFVKWGIPSEKCQKQGDFPSEKCKEVK